MPAVVNLVQAISNAVVAGLAAANYPPLTDGRILIGRQFQFEQSSPPRIIFTPVSSKFEAKDVYNRSVVSTSTPYSTEQLLQNRRRSLMSEQTTFEVRCWGSASPPDPDFDFDYTQALYQQVLISTHLIAVGSYLAESGKWTDSTFQSGQLDRFGREFVFNLTFFTPVLDKLLPLAPSDVQGDLRTGMIIPSTEEEGQGCGPTDP